MPVIGTPIPLFGANPPVWVPLITLTPGLTSIYRVPLPGKMRGVAVRQCQQVQINVNLVDGNGNPVDLTQYGFPASGTDPRYVIAAALTEACELENTGEMVTGTVLDPTQGLVQFAGPQDLFCTPQVLTAEVGAFKDNGLIFSNRLYVLIERGLFLAAVTTPVPSSQMPTLQELRVALRDSPEGNLLTNAYEHDVADYCEALVRAVNYWNGHWPPLNVSYSTITFPDRQFWLLGVKAFAYEQAAAWFRRNQLSYQAAGVAVDDLNKAKEYDELAAQNLQQFERWTVMTKAQINLASCFSTFGSTYGLPGVF